MVYILVTFTQNEELGIGTLEAIAVPKDFRDQSFHHQLDQLRGFVGTKKIIGINWPKFPSNPGWNLPVESTTKSRSPVQHDMRSCKVITYSEDRDVVVAVRDAMMPPIGVQKAVAKNQLPNHLQIRNMALARNLPLHHLTCQLKITRKTMDIFVKDMEGLGCQLITGGDEDKPDESADSSLHHEDDQKGNSTSESEDEDVIPPTPPPPPAKRRRANQCVKSMGNTTSKRNSSHSKENDSFVTPKRNKKSSAKNSDSQILTSLDVNIFDTPPSSTTKGNPKRVLDEQATEPVDAELHSLNEYKDTIDELKNEISFLNEQIRDSTFELEIERDDYNHKIFEKDATILRLQEEINSLKQLNPQALAKSLNEGLALLHTTLETLTISQVNVQHSRVQLERSESGRTNLVKLHKDYETTIHQNALATAMSYGKAGSKKKDMSKMINIIMEALWDREFMSKHSLTGKKAPTDKTNNPAKPALPQEDVQAITSFIVEFWGTKHKLAIDPSMVHPCITSKLQSEHTAHKSREKLFVEDAGNEVPSE
ncbi:hypothetical protein OUZ56_011512 [Daphnia magna]|uniref:BEN domain-containing protein n=2 Tax=Daphnia magna TaxID=35525 RepID=A0ABQ9Z0D0_9CRUS|nr:hypothetical protein OUZ56_011512 [Daphnia magna]